MTKKDEFEKGYAKRSGVTVEWLHDHNQFGVPCDCGEDGCDGWQMKYIPPNMSIKRKGNSKEPAE